MAMVQLYDLVLHYPHGMALDKPDHKRCRARSAGRLRLGRA